MPNSPGASLAVAEKRFEVLVSEVAKAIGYWDRIHNQKSPWLQETKRLAFGAVQAKAKQFKPREVAGKTVKIEVVAIERLHRHWSAGKPCDEIVVNFEVVSRSALKCVIVPGECSIYDFCLTVISSETLSAISEMEKSVSC